MSNKLISAIKSLKVKLTGDKAAVPTELSAMAKEGLQKEVVAVLQTIYDPEIPVNIYDLGLIYDIAIANDYSILLKMTLTTPGCPVAQTFPGTIQSEIKTLSWVSEAKVEVVWDPPWHQGMMSEGAKAQFAMMGMPMQY